MAANGVNHASFRAGRSASAGDPILASKVTTPSVPPWAVRRPRVTELIACGTRWCPLTVVTGPPGAGKTLAMASWAAEETGAVAWVCLDEFDNRPGVFWSYLVAALRRAGVAVPKASRAARQDGTEDGFLLRFTAALAAQDPPVTLVLDDLHLLTDPQVLKGLEFVLRNVGCGLRLVVASRTDPPLPLHRYRAAGQLTEIRASDLAFRVDEASLLLAQHGRTLDAGSLEILTRRTEGWAAGLRLAAISLDTHPDPTQFVKELATEDSALIGYLVDEVLNVLPPQARELMLSTSILEHFSADAAVDLTGDEHAAAVLSTLIRTNAFIQPIGSGWYRYHTMLAEMLRLKLRHEYPDRVVTLHRRAARWYERNGLLTDAVRQAVQARDWQLAASMVIDGLAIGQIIEPRDGQRLADEFAGMPSGQHWPGPQPYLIMAAAALSAGRPDSCAAALDAADRMLERFPAEQGAPGRLTAAVIRLTTSLRSGNLAAAASAASQAERILGRVPAGDLIGHSDLTRRVLSGRGAIELWSGHLDEAAGIFEAGLAAEAAPGEDLARADWAGHLALAEALRGRLGRAAELAAGAGEPGPSCGNRSPAPFVALAKVHLERNELREARGYIRQADAVLGVNPDKLIGAVAYLIAASGALAEGRAGVAAQIIARARSGWPLSDWLDQQLSLLESRASAAAGDVQAALAAAERACSHSSLAAAIAFAEAWAAAGDDDKAKRALSHVVADSRQPDRVRLWARLVDARLSYAGGDRPRGRQSLAQALALAEREQVRLPFAMERDWLGLVLRRDPELAAAHRRLLASALGPEQLPAPVRALEPAPPLLVESLTEREREVLVHVSGMLNTVEVANEMYISVNTVKTHLRNIYRKLAAANRSEAVRRARTLQLI
jgi:LuxR family transcriptional regulator, maltose regulon positive regulatory protein